MRERRSAHRIACSLIPVIALLGAWPLAAAADPLGILSTFPANAANSASRTGAIEVVFNDTVDAATVNSNTFHVWGRQSGHRRGTYLANPVRFVPDAPFFPGEIIDATLTGGIQTPQGVALKPQTWSFRVATLGCTNMSYEPTSGGVQGSGVGTLGDLDRDGDLDLWMAYQAISRIWLNQGNGTFVDSGQVVNHGPDEYLWRLCLVDVDNDGDLDALPIHARTNAIPSARTVWFNDGAGVFTAGTQHFPVPTFTGDARFGDLDSDGDQDVFFANWPDSLATETNEIWLNDGVGAFTRSAENLGPATNESTAAGIADLDGDGDQDIVVTYVQNGPMGPYLGGAAGVFRVWKNAGLAEYALGSEISIADQAFVDLSVGDMNGDGFHDILGSGGKGAVLLLNDGNGVYPIEQQRHYTDLRFQIILGDTDGDGDLDVFGRPNSHYQNRGDGMLTPVEGAAGWCSDLGDIDGDGDLDAITDPIPIALAIGTSESGVSLQGPSALLAGQPFAYTIAYSNNGPVGARLLTITADFPESHLHVQGFASTTAPAPLLITNAPAWIWQLGGVLMPGESGSLTVTGLLADVAGLTSITARVSVSVAERDDVIANDVAFAAASYHPLIDLTIDGSPVPLDTPGPLGYGAHRVHAGTIVTNCVDAVIDPGGGTRQVCTGWVGTGDVPTSGGSSCTSFTLKTNSTLTWQWQTQHRLTLQADHGAITNGVGGFTPESTTITLYPHPDSGYYFSGWRIHGTAAGTKIPLTLVLLAPTTVSASFTLRQGADYDSDGAADIAVFRPKTGSWYVRQSTDGATFTGQPIAFGGSDTIPVPGDYDGDKLADFAVYAPIDGRWSILRSTDGGTDTTFWGWSAAIPVPADYDGDGKVDVAVYADGQWFVRQSSDHQQLGGAPIGWGWSATIPVPGDYDNDGRADLAVYYPADGTWYVRQSSDHQMMSGNPIAFGWSAALPVQGDYDGDGNTDLAVYSPSDGKWYIRASSTGQHLPGSPIDWGAPVALPVPNDYDGDGKTDIAVYVPKNGKWYIRQSHDGSLLGGGNTTADGIPWGHPAVTPANTLYQTRKALGLVP